MIDKEKIILTVTFIVAICTFSFWQIIKTETGVSIFYEGIGIAFVGYTYVIYGLLTKLSRLDDRYRKIKTFSYLIFLSTVNNMLDEFFFDPTKLELNEYIGFVVLTIMTYINEKRNDITRKKRDI